MSGSILLPDASPIIALGRAGRLGLLRQLYDQVITTRIVADEVVTIELPSWIVINDEIDEGVYERYRPGLDPGESSVLALARDFVDPILLLDDAAARKVSREEGYQFVGTLGIVIAAHDQRLIDDAETLIRQLVAEGLWVSSTIVHTALSLVR